MALKDILVHVENTQPSQRRLNAAINLAVAHQAHLVGLYVVSYPYIPTYIRAQISQEFTQQQMEAARQAAANAEADFTERITRAGIKAEWRFLEGDPVAVLALHSRYADIAVAGQPDSTEGETASDAEMTDKLILSVGRPVLLIPNVGAYPKIGERMLVAWDASRHAARAVQDAIPFMLAAKHVSVVTVDPKGAKKGPGGIPSADLCRHLARHGIKAEDIHLTASDIDAGEALLSQAVKQKIDLFVMGAYGHTRWREIVLGGVTRHMLEHMTMPVLLSH
jgi:nucleotide-binding universal stress UspA family protein